MTRLIRFYGEIWKIIRKSSSFTVKSCDKRHQSFNRVSKERKEVVQVWWAEKEWQALQGLKAMPAERAWMDNQDLKDFRACEALRGLMVSLESQATQDIRWKGTEEKMVGSLLFITGLKNFFMKTIIKKTKLLSQVRSLPPAHSFVETWSWKNFYSHSSSFTDSRRAVVSYWRKNVH